VQRRSGHTGLLPSSLRASGGVSIIFTDRHSMPANQIGVGSPSNVRGIVHVASSMSRPLRAARGGQP
jgi:hypothetical protein